MGADSDDENEAVEEQLAGNTTDYETADNNQLIALGAKARLANLKI